MGFLIWLPVVFTVKALFSSGGEVGGWKKKKKSHLYVSFANDQTASINNNAGKRKTLIIIYIFLISIQLFKCYWSLPVHLVSGILEFYSRAPSWQRGAVFPVFQFPVRDLGPGNPSLCCAAGIGASSPVHAPASALLSDWTMRSTVHQ